MKVGDQLLEVCGINMRSATYQLAANVLRQCGNSITMLVQYSPESKFYTYLLQMKQGERKLVYIVNILKKIGDRKLFFNHNVLCF